MLIKSAESASIVGLTGAAIQSEKGAWFIDWGFLPLNDRKLQAAVTVEFNKILAVCEKGLLDYIVRNFLKKQPILIAYIFNHPSLVKLTIHLLRHCTDSASTCRNYSAGVKKYAEWIGHNLDAIIADVKPVGAVADPIKEQNHCGFLNDYIAELQDAGLDTGAVSNCIKAVKAFYRANGIKKVELDEPLSRKVKNKDRAPKPEELAIMLDKAAVREAFVVAAIASGGFREGTFCRLKYRHVKEDLEAGRVPIHIHVEANITKGQYHEYDTFLNVEASQLLKLYLDDRRRGI